MYLVDRSNLITGNAIHDNKQFTHVPPGSSGILLQVSHDNEIIGNEIFDNVDGIHQMGSHGNNFKENTIRDNTRHGIKLFGWKTPDGFTASSHSNTVTSNDIYGNVNGVFVQGYSDHNYIEGNVIRDNERGVFLEAISIIRGVTYRGAAYENEIRENDIHGNNFGIYINNAEKNIIQYNNINDNPNYGVWTNTFTDARFNWWGHPRGPTQERHSHLRGDRVSAKIAFAP